MTQPRSFLWSRIFVGGLVACTAAMAVVGILSMFRALPIGADPIVRFVLVVAAAGVAGFALATAQMATAMAQVLQGRGEHAVAFRLALGCAALCGLVSLAGVHLGWCVLTGQLGELPPTLAIDAGGLGLAFVKPALAFVIEACRTVDRQAIAAAEATQAQADRAAAERARDADRDASVRRAELAAQPRDQAPVAQVTSLATERARRAPPTKKPTARPIAKAATAALVGLAPTAAAAQDLANPAPIERSAETPARPLGWTPSRLELEQAGEALQRRGVEVSQRNLARELGCTRHAVRRGVAQANAAAAAA